MTWTEKVTLKPGITVYKNVLKKELKLQSRLESVLSDINERRYNWAEALVGYNEKMPDYRDCSDFKFNKAGLNGDESNNANELRTIWQDAYDAMLPAVDNYRGDHNISELRYWEAMNFVRYNEGQHFKEHSDHGFSYNCTVSLVAYLNDDYEGGSLYFRTWDLDVKPEAGDVFLFPSNYMYPHQAQVVTKGTKYSIVTMLDYSDKYHKPEFYRETGS